MEIQAASPLFKASQNGQENVVTLLLDRGADIETKTNRGSTPLYLASQNGHENVVTLLLDRGADIETKENLGFTPLLIASQNGHENVVTLLLDRGADIETKTNRGFTPLSIASLNGHENVVTLLLDRGADIETKAIQGFTPLSIASLNGHENVVTLLLDRGADIETKTNRGFTPLSIASLNGHENVVTLLLDRGADIETKTTQGVTSLSLASLNGHEKVVTLLLDRGADIETKSKKDWAPIHFAANYGQLATMILLIKRGANIERKNNRGQSPLNMAATIGKKDAVALLIKHDADCRSRDCDRFSPLENSIIHGQVDVIEYLFKLFSDRGDSRSQVRERLELAARHGQNDAIRFLVKMYQTKIDCNKFLASSLAAAVSNGHFESVRLLHSLGETPLRYHHELGECLTDCDCMDIYLYLLIFKRSPEAVTSSGDNRYDHLCYSDRIDWDIFENALSPLVSTGQKNITALHLVNLPGLGSIKSLPQGKVSNLKQTIWECVKKITGKKRVDEFTTTALIGSMAESTKVGFTDEFDIILQKEYPLHPNKITNIGHGYRKYEDETVDISSKLFHSVIWADLDTKDDMLVSIPTAVAGDGAACTCMKLRYQDEQDKKRSLLVSVDLVPVIHVKDWPSDAIQKTWMMNSAELKARGYQLVARPPHKDTKFGKTFDTCEREKLYRVTFSLLEVEHIKNLEDRVKDAYILAKCLRNPVACHVVIKDEGVIHFVGKFVTSYFLKTVFMHNVEDFLNHERPLVEMAYILYSQLEYYLSHGYIPIFWMPKINLLEGVDISAAKAHKVAAHMKAHVGERYREELNKEPPDDVNDKIELPPECSVIDFTEASGTEILSLPLKLGSSRETRRRKNICYTERGGNRSGKRRRKNADRQKDTDSGL
ncbi:ankyrin-3-like isoform X2 [Lineus longissimus]|uniref:ankyrin-3-like isoform X2 n=1 Tax=Lineus longissimus TaxID=88925 RepID=UPI00315CA330